MYRLQVARTLGALEHDLATVQRIIAASSRPFSSLTILRKDEGQQNLRILLSIVFVTDELKMKQRPLPPDPGSLNPNPTPQWASDTAPP